MPNKVFDIRGEVSADVSPFDSAMNKSADSASKAFQLMKSAASAFIGSGVIRTFIKATDAANKFGQKLADISSIADYNLNNLRKSILGLENVYGRASTVGETMYEIISSGIKGSEADILHFAKVAGQTAVSIKADLYDTANVLTTLTNAYGLGVKDVQKLSDMLFITVREGKAHGNELARTLGLVTNTAAEAGVSLAEMSATISVLSRTQSASQSMIGFNQLLNAIIKPTQEATREAQYWGIELSADALKVKGLSGVLEELHRKTGGNVRAINAMLGNIRAMRAGVSLTGRQFENFTNLVKQANYEIGSGAAYEAFKKQTDTAARSVENLRVQFDKTTIAIGSDLEPITRAMAGFAEDFLKAFASADSFQKWVTYASAFSVALGSAYKVIGGVVTLTKAVQANTQATAAQTGAVSAQTTAVNDTLKNAVTHVQNVRTAFKGVSVASKAINAQLGSLKKTLDGAAKQGAKLATAFGGVNTAAKAAAVNASSLERSIKAGSKQTDSAANSAKALRDAYSKVLSCVKDVCGQLSTAKVRTGAITTAAKGVNAEFKKGATALKPVHKAIDTAIAKLKQAQKEAVAFNAALKAAGGGATAKRSRQKTAGVDATAQEDALASVRSIKAAPEYMERKVFRAGFPQHSLDEYRSRYVVPRYNRMFGGDYTSYTDIRSDIAENRRFRKAFSAPTTYGSANAATPTANAVGMVQTAVYDALRKEERFKERVTGGSVRSSSITPELRQKFSAVGRDIPRIAAVNKQLAAFKEQLNTLTRTSSSITPELRQKFIRVGKSLEVTASTQSKFAAVVSKLTGLFKTTSSSVPPVSLWSKLSGTVGKFTNGLGSVLSTLGIWGMAASVLGNLTKTLVDRSVDSSIAEDTKATDKAVADSLREVAYKRLDAAKATDSVTDAEYKVLFTAISLANSQEQLSKIYQDIAKDEQSRKEKSLNEKLADIEKEHANKRKDIDKEAAAGASRLTPEVAKELKKGLSSGISAKEVAQTQGQVWFQDTFGKLHNYFDSGLGSRLKQLGGDVEYTTYKEQAGPHANDYKVGRELSISNKLEGELLAAFSEDNWKEAVKKIQDRLGGVLGSDKATPVEKTLLGKFNNMVKELSAVREKGADTAEYVNTKRKESYAAELEDVVQARVKGFEDFIFNDMYQVEAAAGTRTVNDRGESAATQLIPKREELIGRAEQRIADEEAAYNSLFSKYTSYGLSADDVENLLKPNKDRIQTAKQQLNKLLEDIDAVPAQHVEALNKKIKEELYDDKGVKVDESTQAATLRKAIDEQYALATNTTSRRQRIAYTRGAEALQEQLDSLYEGMGDKRTKLMGLRVDAGRATEQQALKEQVDISRESYKRSKSVSDAYKTELKKLTAIENKVKESVDEGDESLAGDYATLRNRRSVLSGISVKAQERTEMASLKLQAALRKLNDASLDTATSLRSGLMAQVNNFAKDRDAQGNLSNNALYHSINLMSRLGGGNAIQTARGLQMDIGGGKTANFKNAQEAQSAVSRSLDAYILSQQYAEANKGRAVVDIYNLLKQNIGKGITVN